MAKSQRGSGKFAYKMSHVGAFDREVATLPLGPYNRIGIYVHTFTYRANSVNTLHWMDSHHAQRMVCVALRYVSAQ